MVGERSCLGSIKYTAREVETDSRANRVSVSRRYGGAEGGEARKEARRRSNLVATRGTCDVYTKAGILYKACTHTDARERARVPLPGRDFAEFVGARTFPRALAARAAGVRGER